MQKIYIAGFDVFEEDAIARGKKYTSLCREYGFIGMYPLDNEVDFSKAKHTVAEVIFKANTAMIRQADIIIANLNPFRGKEADSGTVWECGYGFSLGKKVYGYMQDTRPYLERFSEAQREQRGEMFWDSEGRFIEDFDHPVNLMIACSALEIVQGGFEDVLKRIVRCE
ncbi:MAG: nucleoside 2-deoxyribosyltransferase [Thiovulaceae bacterium]|jgi:nucleoside 2-deoxyribosyltransferase|nr:nucleoside 2-deoxyribosyltransferase [Sulfurimonadaceae bacterium]MDD3817510.1 nucleoside 2-deoxyribosyltransferase [Sulfurimonadaceae bacterium]